MKIIDFNKKNRRLIVELTEEEYCGVYMRQSIINVHTRWKNELTENGELKIVDDVIKPKISEDTLGKLNDAIFSVSKCLTNANRLPDKAVMITLGKRELTIMLERVLETLNQIKKEVE